jgi:asparagine synthase (glutamine-hydrolysing)
MCGIAGFLGKYPRTQASINASLVAMKNRGPDSIGVHHGKIGNSTVQLLFTRLAIIDLDERSNQPFIIGPYAMVFNGEIYNYKELRSDLEKRGVEFRTNSDSEVLLQSYIVYGDKCLERFEGMWAFAIADSLKNQMFLARDRFGEKPLYFTKNSGGIYFASETRALAALSGQKFTVNENQVQRFLVNGYKALYKTSDTFYKEVTELQPFTQMTIDGNLNISTRTYWTPQFKPQKMTYEEALEGTREALTESVRIRLRADVPLAFCLSGGIDSSSIVSLAAKVHGCNVATYSIIDSDERYNEEANIMATVRDIGCEHHMIRLEKKADFSFLENLVRYHDAPVYTISYLVHAFLSQAIASDGRKVVFSGTGADEFFTGYYDHFLMYLYEMRDHENFDQFLQQWRDGVGKVVRNPMLSDPHRFINNPQFREHLYNDPNEFKDFLITPFTETFSETNFTSESLLRNRMMNELFHEGTRPILHEDDLNSMLFSLENRSPFLDSKLFAHCYSIPSEYLIKLGQGKHLLRESMKGILNDQVRLDRVKKGFNASIMSLVDFNNPKVNDFLMSPSPIFDFVDRKSIASMFTQERLKDNQNKFLFTFASVKMFLDMQQ